MRQRSWTAFIGLGTLAAGASMFCAPDLRAILTSVIGLMITGFLFARGVRMSRRDRTPVLLMAGAGLLFLVGSGLRVGLDAESGPNFPSIGEPVLLVSYLCIFAAATVLARLRRAGPDQDGLTDALVVAAAFAVITWSLWLAPYVRDSSETVAARAVNVAFAVCSALIVVAIIRLAAGPGSRAPSFYLLLSGMTLFVLSDLAATVASTGRSTAWVSQVPGYFGPWIYVLFGAAVAHSSLSLLTKAPTERTLSLTRGRRSELMGALLVPPGMLAINELTRHPVDLTALFIGWIVMAYLVVVRFTRLVDGHRRVAHDQQVLRRANARLAAASSRQAMHQAVLEAVTELAGDGDAAGLRISIAKAEGSELHVIDVSGSLAREALAVAVPLATLPDAMVEGLTASKSVSLDGIRPVDLPSLAANTTVSVLALPLHLRGDLSGAVLVTSDQPLLVDVRRNVEILASTVSLALESATLTENLLRRRSERRFRALVENSSDIILVVDDARQITFASPAAHRLLGLPDKAFMGSHLARWVHADDWPPLAHLLDGEEPAVTSSTGEVEVRMRHVDGSHRWFEIRTKDLQHDPEIDGLVVTAREITDRKAAEAQLAHNEARFRALVQNSTDVVAVIDEFGHFSYVSPAVAEMLGFTPEEVEGTLAIDILAPGEFVGFSLSYPELTQHELPVAELQTRRFEAQVKHRSGEFRTLDVGVTDMRHEPAVNGVVLNARDITVRKALERDLRYQALHDSLTGLANRTMFTQQTATALRSASPHAASVGALFIDLDDFKTVNDSLGHAVGDQLLQEVAHRLITNLSSADLAARLGGDEFAILVVDAAGERGVLQVADQVLDLVAQPFTILGREIRVTCSIGIAMATADDADAEVLLRSADVAMYLAKERGKNRAAMFEDHLHTSVFERLELKADLVRAIEDGQLRCHYQPIVSLQTGRITGVEALVRWDHPIKGRLKPDAFIPLAEDTGLIVPLGRWVLREACAQLRAWQLALPPGSSLTISVNLSVRQLAHEHIISDVREAIEDAQLDPSTLTLEITETTLMHDTEVTRHRLAQLRELGVSLAVDDFGTGYSSLQYVQRFPIDIIKIDRSFVTGLGTNPGDGAVVQSMIELAQRLGVHTVAEGIDRPEQVTLLQSLGADLGQGYLFSEPVSADQIDALLASSPTENPKFSLR